MAEKQNRMPSQHDLDAKWDACIDLSLRRVAYSTLAGTFSGLILFRTPTTRWASVALGAGVGIGSAYTECSRMFGVCPVKSTESDPKALAASCPVKQSTESAPKASVVSSDSSHGEQN